MSIVQWLLLILVVAVVVGVYVYMRRQAATDPWRNMDEPEESLADSTSMNGDSYVVGVRTVNHETPADRKAAAAARADRDDEAGQAPPPADRTRAPRSPTAVRRRPAPPEPEPEPLPKRQPRQTNATSGKSSGARSSELDTPRGLKSEPDETPAPASQEPATGAGLETPSAHATPVARHDMVAPQPGSDSQVFVLHVAAPEGQAYAGTRLIETLEALDLKFGLNDLYHRVTEQHGVTESVFAVASMVKPGTLHPAEAESLVTPGLSFFLLVPGPMEGRAAMHDMMETAHKLTTSLGGTVLDDKRALLKAQTAQFVLDQIAEIDRKARLAKRRG